MQKVKSCQSGMNCSSKNKFLVIPIKPKITDCRYFNTIQTFVIKRPLYQTTVTLEYFTVDVTVHFQKYYDYDKCKINQFECCFSGNR